MVDTERRGYRGVDRIVKRPGLIVKIPRESRVLLLEDSYLRVEWFMERLLYVKCLTVANTVDEAIAGLESVGPFDFMFLDHDLGLLDYMGVETETSGLQFCKHIAANDCVATVFIHSHNTSGALAMKACLKDAYVHVAPFGTFELEVK